MTVFRRFLTPGWVIGLVLVAAFAYACLSFLAPWQLGKNSQLDTRNRQLTSSVTAAPAPLASFLTDPSSFSGNEWHLATARGQYVSGSDVLVRLGSVEGEPVYQVLSVFRTTSGAQVLVSRGHIPVGERNTVPAYAAAPTGEVELTGRLRASSSAPPELIVLDGYRSVRSVNVPAIGADLGHPLVSGGYLQLTAGQPGTLSPMPIPAIENGPYLSYGLQWIAFGIFAPLGLAYFARSELKARRAEARTAEARREEARTAGAPEQAHFDTAWDDTDGAAPPAASPSGPTSTPSPTQEQQALHDRYGERFDAERRLASRRRNRLATDRAEA